MRMRLSRGLPGSVLLLPFCRGFVPSLRTAGLTHHVLLVRPSSSSTFVATNGSSSRLFEKNAPRHDVGSSAQVELSPAEQAKMEAYGNHQSSAPKLGFATDIRSLIAYNHGFAVLSTFSKADPDYPGGSVVGFAPDDQGRPLFIFSGMSAHTQDILANPHCSLTVAAKDFKGAADARVNLMGRAELLKDADEKAAAKTIYMKKHPGAFWVDFGDFNWFRMSVDKVRFVGGFARAGSVTAAEYTAARPDVVAAFSADIASHMNQDHMSANIAMVQTNVPGMEPDPDNPITEALITSVDTLGMFIKVTRDKPVKYLPQQFKLRLPFPRPAESRKDVKMLIMELCQPKATETSSSASSA
jgi:putative heme iron utilization protein